MATGDSAAVVTGLGAVSPAGIGTDALWRALRNGGCAPDPIKHFDTKGARVREARAIPGEQALQGRENRTLDLLLRAGRQAISDSGAPPGKGIGIIIASTENEGGAKSAKFPGRGASIVSEAASALDLSGPAVFVSSASASGSVAVGLARDMINGGEVESAVVVGADSVVETAFMGLDSLRMLSTDGCRPFSSDRTGISISEASCALFLESPGSAARRRRTGYAHIIGYGCSNHGNSLTASDKEGIVRAVNAALHDSGLEPGHIDFVNAHATGTRQGDVAEVMALRELFGPRIGKVAVLSSKGILGHCQGAAGTIEALATILSLVHRRIPISHRSAPVDPSWPDLDIVLSERSISNLQYGLSISCGLGGVHAALVIRGIGERSDCLA